MIKYLPAYTSILLHCNTTTLVFQVELIFTETVATLIDQTNIRQTQMRTISKFSPNGYTTPVYLVQHKIWGVTALMLHYALQAIIPETYKFEMRLRT